MPAHNYLKWLLLFFIPLKACLEESTLNRKNFTPNINTVDLFLNDEGFGLTRTRSPKTNVISKIFLIAPFPDRCLLVPFYMTKTCLCNVLSFFQL